MSASTDALGPWLSAWHWQAYTATSAAGSDGAWPSAPTVAALMPIRRRSPPQNTLKPDSCHDLVA
ncbi:hypothetical protein, partial [Mycobacterium avium]|uniref:hypothetical protein n=1 Tax=Mycobacterium avium TaxID=1764 RepID=UPI00373FD77D